MRTQESYIHAINAGTMAVHGPGAPYLEALRAEYLEERASYLESLELSTAELEQSDQFAVWHDSFAPILELTEVDGTPADFNGRQKLWDLGNLAFAEIGTDKLAFTSVPGHVRREPLDHWAITLLRSGTNRTDSGKSTFSGGPGEIQIHPLGRPFVGDISKSEMLMLFVPRDFCRETAVALSSAEFSKLGTGMGRLFSDYLLGVANRLPTLTEAELPGLVAATRAMILACVSPSPDNIAGAEEPISATLLERARKIVQAKLLDPDLGVETVRRELGVSRTRLYNLFEPFGGVRHYIQHRRLLEAHSALADSDDRRLILRIAEAYGFPDGAEFSRAFKREFGYSPSDARREGQGAIPRPQNRCLLDCAAEERLGVLLRRLQG